MSLLDNYVFVDVEADGPIPFQYSMVCFGAVIISKDGSYKSFYGKTKPISHFWQPAALAVSGFTRDEHEMFDNPANVMADFSKWISENIKAEKKMFITDNLAFDWQWMNFYFHRFVNHNPFGHSGRRIGDIYSGYKMNLFKSSEWKKLRKAKHDHNPVNDALGNAQATLEFISKWKRKIN